jgi:hypothetical protein
MILFWFLNANTEIMIEELIIEHIIVTRKQSNYERS